MIPTRSARTSASSRYCVVRNTVTPASRRSSVTSSQSAVRLCGSRPVVGSSRNRISRRVHERQGEVEAPLHAAGVAGDLPVGRVRQADPVEQLLGPCRALGLRHSLEGRLQPEVVASGEQRVEGGLLERDADQRTHLRPLADDVVAADAGGSGGRRQERRQDVDGGGLPGAVRPQEPVDLARRDGEVDPVHRPWALAVLADEALDLDPVRPLHRPTLATGRRRPAAEMRVTAAEMRVTGTGFARKCG